MSSIRALRKHVDTYAITPIRRPRLAHRSLFAAVFQADDDFECANGRKVHTLVRWSWNQCHLWPIPGMKPNTGREMTERFKIGEHVTWNSEAGRVSGTIKAIHTSDFDYKSHRRRASEDDPQYEIKSDKTDHIAAHKGSALTRSERKNEE